jgi:phosphotransferase system enzyme I (PtsP)
VIVREVRRRGKSVSVCGEMAADPAAAILLLGAGVKTFSMNASALPRIKWVIRSFSSTRAKQILGKALHMESAKSIRQMLNGELERAGLAS